MSDEQPDTEVEYDEPESDDQASVLRYIARMQREVYREQRKTRLALERIAKAIERLGKR